MIVQRSASPEQISNSNSFVNGINTMDNKTIVHTFQAGVHSRYAVLDKVVPGYYHRRTETGEVVCSTTLCNFCHPEAVK